MIWRAEREGREAAHNPQQSTITHSSWFFNCCGRIGPIKFKSIALLLFFFDWLAVIIGSELPFAAFIHNWFPQIQHTSFDFNQSFHSLSCCLRRSRLFHQQTLSIQSKTLIDWRVSWMKSFSSLLFERMNDWLSWKKSSGSLHKEISFL